MAKKNLNPADAYHLESAIKELEESRSDAGKLAELKAELENINRKKAEYVAEHPEARRLVYRRRKEGEPEPELPLKKRNLFKKNGLPRHPERSIYYDPVMNPFGVAPPGMPYVERPLRPDEIDSDVEMEDVNEGDEDDIPLPSGLPPGTEEVTSDDDIPMPDGPPPGREKECASRSNATPHVFRHASTPAWVSSSNGGKYASSTSATPSTYWVSGS
ncbi:hypothetical protein NLJ89_g1872 [Agrocybe chaxingu]|uniref:Uncharacterized protein n=1 Tax=Agrocybe chaxingu TaxID=84603 RepID=A0A9W8MZ72_9AGAR|nr:hypothetical protein NLJ89_g1872 [Agrocybe chaxingu]